MTPKQIASIKKACEGKTMARLEREAQGIFSLEFMRLTLLQRFYQWDCKSCCKGQIYFVEKTRNMPDSF